MEEIQVSSWKELFELELTDSAMFYRGQSDASWPIESSLRRHSLGTDYEEDINNREYWCLRQFVRRAPGYLERSPADGDYIAWLSLMQHHGTPTRLIDFSHSFYVACYFALRDAKTDAAVWAIDYSWLNNIAEKSFKIKLSGLRDEWDDTIYQQTNQLLSRELKTAAPSGKQCPRGVVFVDPMFSHRRLASQQGLFLVPLDIDVSFMDNLTHHKQMHPWQFRKVVLQYGMRDEALMHLRAMNITEESLFPGLDGLAREIRDRELY